MSGSALIQTLAYRDTDTESGAKVHQLPQRSSALKSLLLEVVRAKSFAQLPGIYAWRELWLKRVQGIALLYANILIVAFCLLFSEKVPADPTAATGNEATGIFGENASSPVSALGSFVQSYPFELPRARGNVDQHLELTYNSSATDLEAGYGWGLEIGWIQRSPLSGWPDYDDKIDRFTFAGRVLSFVCSVGQTLCGTIAMPTWAQGWRYYREKVDSSFSRYFLSPDGQTWRVQAKGGMITEYGRARVAPDLTEEATDREQLPNGASAIFRWLPARQFDLDDNLIAYQWIFYGRSGRRVLSDIWDTAPVSGPITRLSFAHHTQLTWEIPPFWPMSAYAHIDRARHDVRLKRVAINSMPWDGKAPRIATRIYHLDYYSPRSTPYDPPTQSPLFHHSFLKSIQLEGNCGTPEVEGYIQADTYCPRQPPITFRYAPGNITAWAAGSARLLKAPAGADADYKVLVDLNSASILDINHDGLPDIVQSWSSIEQIDSVNRTSQRALWGYLNRGMDNSVRLVLEHQCMDAGQAPGSITFSNPMLQQAAFLNMSHGATVIGRWGDAQALWSSTDYGPVSVATVAPNLSFCPEAATDPSHGAFAWLSSTRAAWVKNGSLSGANNAASQWFADVDGDGYADAVSRKGRQSSFLDEAQVLFTRQYRLGDPRVARNEPALRPFDAGFSLSLGTSSLAPASTANPADNRFFYADINGDGLADLVTVIYDNPADPRYGFIEARPGDGRGNFACKAVTDSGTCNGAPAPTPWITAPFLMKILDTADVDWPVQPSQPELFVHDVTADGLADLVQIVVDQNVVTVRIWVNEDGRNFRCANPQDHCTMGRFIDDLHALSNNIDPHRVMFADMDGGGRDGVVVLGKAGAWFVSFVGSTFGPTSTSEAPRPGLLTAIDNGRGATTSIEYTTAQHLDLVANLRNNPWAFHAPSVITVVKKVNLRDTQSLNTGSSTAEPFAINRTVEYDYRDPAWDPWERRILGFRKTRIQANGEAVTQITRWFGRCYQPDAAMCPESPDGDPEQAMSGLPVRIDRFVTAYDGTPNDWLSSESYHYVTASTFSGPGGGSPPDGGSHYAYAARQVTFHYDANKPVQPGPVSQTSGDSIESPPRQPQSVFTTLLRAIDGNGDLRVAESQGRGMPDDRGIRVTADYNCDQTWRCEMKERATAWVSAPPAPDYERRLRFGYDSAGRLNKVEGLLDRGGVVDRFHENGSPIAPLPTAGSTPGWRLVSSLVRDKFGNIVRIEAGGQVPTCTSIEYDRPYAQLPERIRVHTSDCLSATLNVDLTYERGFEQVVEERRANGTAVQLKLDEYGRPKEFLEPTPEAPFGTMGTAATVDYYDGGPVDWKRIRKTVSAGLQTESIEISNGLGEPALSFERGYLNRGDVGGWIGVGRIERDSSGRVVRSFAPWTQTQIPTSTLGSLSPLPPPPGTLSFSQVYDDFGRLTGTLRNSLPIQSIKYYPLIADFYDANQTGPDREANLRTTQVLDGHGRIARTIRRLPEDDIITDIERLPTGEPTTYTYRHRAGPQLTKHEMQYDSLGRLLLNIEPNTSVVTSAQTRAWRYVWDDNGRLVATSDARGCGTNLFYGAYGRLVGEDYSPCTKEQPAYTAPDLVTGEGLETFYRYDYYEPGQLASLPGFAEDTRFAIDRITSVRDRATFTRMAYDIRGRVRRLIRSIAVPDAATMPLASRYENEDHERRFEYNLQDQLVSESSGVKRPEFLVNGESAVNYTYTPRGILRGIGSSYGDLIHLANFSPDGAVSSVALGDIARTTTTFQYDTDRRPSGYKVGRNAPALWSTSTSTYSRPGTQTTVTQLADVQLILDPVGNPKFIGDAAKAGWPPDFAPFDQTIDYDALYRVRAVGYAHAQGAKWSPVFEHEMRTQDHAPVPEAIARTRVAKQTFDYDWANNTTLAEDDHKLYYDRSLGPITNGTPTGEGPHQLRAAHGIKAQYDASGNLVDLRVERPGRCMSGFASYCAQRFVYDWDEVGELMRARRWDYPANAIPATEPVWPAVPAAAPTRDIRYANSKGERVRRTVTSPGAATVHDLDIFETLRLKSASFDANKRRYVTNAASTEVFMAGFARTVYAPTLPSLAFKFLRTFLELSDALGSPSITIDRDTSEVVERVNYLPFGATESHFRPERWGAQRDGARFTGKAADIEVGLINFGARYLHANLGRWASPDPLVIHGADQGFNPYAYVDGRLLATTDPTGLAVEEENITSEDANNATIDDDGTVKMPPIRYNARMQAPQQAPAAPTEPEEKKKPPFNGIRNPVDRWLLQTDNFVTRFLQDDRRLERLQWGIAEGTAGALLTLGTGGTALAAGVGGGAAVVGSQLETKENVALSSAAGVVGVIAGGKGGAAVKVARLAANSARGNAFQTAVHVALNLPRNTTTAAPKALVWATLRRTIVDYHAAPSTVVEIKDAIKLSFTAQLRAQANIAAEHSVPYSVIVGTRNKSLSKPLIEAVYSSGGFIAKFDKAKGVIVEVLDPATRTWVPSFH